jgi:hypothetical protein
VAIVVTLHVYSGRRDPSWRLSPDDEARAIDRLRSLSQVTNQRPSGVFGGLGYRGMSISRTLDLPGRQQQLFVHEEIVDQGFGAANLIDETGMESWLLESARQVIDDDLRAYVQVQIAQRRIDTFSARAERAVVCPKDQAADSPAYNPSIWNEWNVQISNNCYDYANDHATNTFAQPGFASGNSLLSYACREVTAAAQSDGLRIASGFSAPLAVGAGWYVGLVVWPGGKDFHWYRQDDAGCWSHKPGQTAARNFDNSGNQITDPQTCDCGPYEFCAYMVTDRNVQIGGDPGHDAI